jgi:hypothetical protein
LKDIFDQVEAVFGTKGTIGRNVKMYLSQKHAGEKLKGIGACFGIENPVFPGQAGVLFRSTKYRSPAITLSCSI